MKTLLLTAAPFLVLSIFGFGFSRSLTVRVVDENQRALSGIVVNFDFEISTFSGSPFTTKTRTTNSNGEVSASGKANAVGFYILTPGYYKSGGFYGDPKFVTTVLKKINQPKPMYARHANCNDLTFPNDGRPYGYDLIVGDWLPPLGHGLTADFIFKANGYWRNGDDQNNSLLLTFSNPEDGIQSITVVETGSVLRLPKLAPLVGYQNQWVWRSVSHPGELSGASIVPAQANRGYFFRIRSKKDSKGNIVALYGKMSRDLDYGIDEKNQVGISINSYYVNPDGTQTMEFDVTKNLATGASAKAVKEP